jgi:signal transduction histidine kinase
LAKEWLHKGKVAMRVKYINLAILIFVFVVVVASAFFTMTGVAREASMRLAYVHALEAVGNFNLHVSGELAVLGMAANSAEVRAWFADEGNLDKKQAAFNELWRFASSLQSEEFYFGVLASLNEYTMNLYTTLTQFAPYGRMSRYEPMDAWFFELIEVDNHFLFNIDVDKIEHRWRIWINYIVMHEGHPVGVLSTSVRIYEVLHSMFGRYDEDVITGFIIDNSGYIHLGSTYLEHYTVLVDELLHIRYVDNGLGDFITNSINQGIFTHESPTEIIRLSDGFFGYAAVAPIADSDWMVVTLFSNDALFSIHNLIPLLALLVLAIIIYSIASAFVTRRYVLVPVMHENKAIENLSRMKTEFLATISHELKTPLYLMGGFAELTVWEYDAGTFNEETRENLQIISKEAQRLAQLVSNLLEISLIEPEENVRVPIDAITSRTKALCEPILAKNDNVLEVIVGEGCPPVNANPDAILQVLVNLIENAIRFARDDIVKVSVENLGETVLFNVEDNGDGISPEVVDKVFERGFSGDGGTGLGLAICKETIEVHGGEIKIEKKLDKGTRITFTIPIFKE